MPRRSRQVIRSLVVLLALVALSGCVTGRRSFDLPVNSALAPVGNRGIVHIASVTDDRHFEIDPSDPSVPSVNGDAAKMSASQRDRMIGRQRNTFGKAMGDVSLPTDDSVTQKVRSLVEQGLIENGYRISEDPKTPQSIAVSIRNFWGWMTPGFFALTFEAKINCAITASGPGGVHTIIVNGYGINHGQFAKDVNWVEAFDPAFKDFVSKIAVQLQDLRLQGTTSIQADPAANQ
ncbi:MAG: YajG family lipoprotein [Gammaproteobacteria bacterium]